MTNYDNIGWFCYAGKSFNGKENEKVKENGKGNEKKNCLV